MNRRQTLQLQIIHIHVPNAEGKKHNEIPELVNIQYLLIHEPFNTFKANFKR